MAGYLVKAPTRLRRTEGTAWCGAQTPALSFPHLRILPAPLAPLLAISLALLCAAGPVCGCGHGAKRRGNLLGHLVHLSFGISDGRLGSGDTFSLLNLVAGGQLDVGLHLVVHIDRLRQRYFAGLRRWAKRMLAALLPIIPCTHQLISSSDSRHSLLSLTCPPHALNTHVGACLARPWLLALCLAG